MDRKAVCGVIGTHVDLESRSQVAEHSSQETDSEGSMATDACL